MAKVSQIQNNFNSGIFRKRLHGRTDLQRYKNAAEEIDNFFLVPQGGLRRRTGTVFVGEVRDSSKPVRMIDFEFSAADSYVLILNDGRIEFMRNKGRVLEAEKSVTAITNASPLEITLNSHGYENGDRVYFDTMVGMTELEENVYFVANKDTNTFELEDQDGNPVDSTNFGIFTSGKVYRVYSITHPWTDTEIDAIQWAQDADTIYVVCSTKSVRKIVRGGHTNWVVSEVDFTFGPFQKSNSVTTHTMNPSSTTGTITIVSSTAYFNANHVGALIKIGGTTGTPAKQGYAKITVFTSTTQVTATVVHTLSGSSATDNWAIGAFSTDAGFPRAIVFHESRLFLAGTNKQPRNVWGSVIEDFENMESDEEDDSALDIPVLVIKGTPIVWLASEDVLAAGSSDGIVKISASGDSTITPDNLSAKRQSSVGASSVSPANIGSFIYYVQSDSKTLREFKFEFESDRYISLNMSLTADDLMSAGVKRIAYQQSPDSILFCVLNDGKMVTFTRERNQEVMGWATSETDGNFKDIVVIPQSSFDEVWLVVERTIDSVTRKYIEYLENDVFGTQADEFFVDSGLKYDGSATDEIRGIEHLEGKEVSILVDGAVHPNKTVTDGMVTLDYEGEKVICGLPYVSTLKTLRVDAGSSIGSAQNKTKRINKVMARVWDSLGMKAGSPDKQDPVVFRTPNDLMNNPPELYTGDKEIQHPGGYDREGQVVIIQDQPLPLNISAVVIELTEFDK